MVVLPHPALVFGSLARGWNNLAPAPLQIDRKAVRGYAEEHVVVKRLDDIRTRMQQFRRTVQVGFLGRVTYGLLGDNDAARTELNALAEFAFYGGVGMKTAMGMGQCRRVVDS